MFAVDQRLARNHGLPQTATLIWIFVYLLYFASSLIPCHVVFIGCMGVKFGLPLINRGTSHLACA